MKKSFASILIAIVLACSLVFTAAAADFESNAQDLNDLGLFLGTDDGYELDRAPNRAEAVIMLVRLLGLEEEAFDGDYSHPFTDVPEWAEPHVAIAFELGYTTGVTATTFVPRDVCTAQMYVTFILRALEYTDDDAVGATLWAEAIEFGLGLGVITEELLEDGEFLRGHMVAVSYLALFTATADGEFDTLLDKLVADGAVDEELAEAKKAAFNPPEEDEDEDDEDAEDADDEEDDEDGDDEDDDDEGEDDEDDDDENDDDEDEDDEDEE